MTEFKLLSTKYKGKGMAQLVKLLFHGAKGVSPEMIYESETGLDARFSRDGAYGQGIYFADNADYSHAYAWTEQKQDGTRVYCLFVCFVLVGDACLLNAGDNSLRLPPLKDSNRS